MARSIGCLGAICLFSAHSVASTLTLGSNAASLVNYSLEELMAMNIAVTSANKRSQRKFDTAAAITVISAEDIERSGASTIPEALRLAPGIQVARMGANEWAVSSRGLNGLFSRYVLVLIDGRSIYDPLFAGVNWDEVDLSTNDIARIEVLRGPGSTLWGSNAVNGVINIVTFSANELSEQKLTVAAGDSQKLRTTLQLAKEIDERLSLRGSIHYVKQQGYEGAERPIEEHKGENLHLKFEGNYELNADQWRLSIDVSESERGAISADTRIPQMLSSNGEAILYNDEDKHGYAAQLKWQRQLNKNSQLRSRLSHDSIRRKANTYDWFNRNSDFDFEWLYKVSNHHFTTGLNSRYSVNEAYGSDGYPITIDPDRRSISTVSAFINDTIEFDHWEITAGIRYEDNNRSEDHTHGTLRALWRGSEHHRSWVALSRAYSTPSRLLTSKSRLTFGGLFPENTPPIVFTATNEDINAPLESTRLDSIELGYRFKHNERLTLDISAFYNEYENLIQGMVKPLILTTDPQTGINYIDSTLAFDDSADDNSLGTELSINWQPHSDWLLQYHGSYLHYYKNGTHSDKRIDGDAPETQHNVRLLTKLSRHIDLHLFYRYVSDIETQNIPSYDTVDLKLDYQINTDLELSLLLNNLGGDHIELRRDAFSADTFYVPTSYQLQINYRLP